MKTPPLILKNILLLLCGFFLISCGASSMKEESMEGQTIWESAGVTPETTSPINPSISINGGDSTTKDTSVILALSASDETGIDGYYVSENFTVPSESDSAWISVTPMTSYSANVPFTLSSGDGKKLLYVWFKNPGGNLSSSANDSISFSSSDTTAPINPSISINNGDSTTASTSVTLSLSASDDTSVTSYYASENSATPASTDSGWTSATLDSSYSANVSFTLSSGYGSKTVYLWYKDPAGNISSAVSDSISFVTVVLASADADGMVHLSGGTFMMGDIQGGGQNNESPVHSVTLSPFYISDHEVTASEYTECVTAGACIAQHSFWGGIHSTLGDTTGKPANGVNWSDTQNYILWKSNASRTYRLCTEAEWEYAARAGTSTKWSCGNTDSCLDSIAWYDANNSPVGPKAVKTKAANAWGLYDMYGNVFEWVNDWYSSTYYSTVSSGVTDPVGPMSGSNRVQRGGAYSYEGWSNVTNLRSAYRHYNPPMGAFNVIGFRLCSDR